MQPDNPAELSPWAVVKNDGQAEESLALWRISLPSTDRSPAMGTGELALAIFSSRENADEYCSSNDLLERNRLVRFDEHQTLRVLLNCYQQGIRYAALDPNSTMARQVFVLRDVLKAARQKLGSRDELKLGGID